MRTTTPDAEPQSAFCPKKYIAANAGAVLFAATVAMLLPRDMRHSFPSHLVWAPVLAFLAAALSCTKLLAPWMTFIALGLVLAALVLFFLAGFVSLTDATVGPSGLAYALPGLLVAGWDLRHLSRAISAA